ncbi:XRE family transcriptional regulator [bacterium 1xD8-6]|nr:XRE family transcriptional regulator [bacterium D16-36]RKI63470.1 XRE family transcriptional regulator [bacterium 1xD8-6]
MEQEKIGEFIAAQRKEKGMTQKQLGDALKISDKTVSKWECGKGLPDISIIMPLCELLNISVNELLSGEHLTEDSYPEKAEENMMQLIQETENQKRDSTRRYYFRTAAWILGNLLILLALIMTSASQKNFPIFFYFDFTVLGTTLCNMFLTLFFSGYTKAFRKAFSFLCNRPESQKELKNAIAAVSLAVKSLIIGGIFWTIFFAIYLLWLSDTFADDSYMFMANLAITLLPILYGFFGTMILLPIKARLEKQQE